MTIAYSLTYNVKSLNEEVIKKMIKLGELYDFRNDRKGDYLEFHTDRGIYFTNFIRCLSNMLECYGVDITDLLT